MLNNKEKYEHWLKVAEDDLDSAEFMFNGGRYSYLTFMCQQAIEKLAKGIYVYTFDEEAKYTHNINLILAKIDSIETHSEYDNYKTFFNELFMYYTAGRYDVYKEKIVKSLDKSTSENILKNTKEAFLWLKSQVKL